MNKCKGTKRMVMNKEYTVRKNRIFYFIGLCNSPLIQRFNSYWGWPDNGIDESLTMVSLKELVFIIFQGSQFNFKLYTRKFINIDSKINQQAVKQLSQIKLIHIYNPLLFIIPCSNTPFISPSINFFPKNPVFPSPIDNFIPQTQPSFIIATNHCVHMHSPNTYILQLFVKKCKINIQQSGSVGLLLRAGKNQSHVTNLQPIINGVINFNSNIKLNIDDSALDTKRCTLTLNFVSSSMAKKVIGIVVIIIPQIGTQTEKTLKVTSTPDKDAQIELSIGLRQLDDKKAPQEDPRLIKSITLKQSEKLKNRISQKNGGFGSMITSLNTITYQTPTSPPSETTEKLNLKSKRSQIESIGGINTEESQVLIEKLQREKELLKNLLKVEMAKSATACNHLKNILEFLQTAVGVGLVNGSLLKMSSERMDSGIANKVSADNWDVCRNGLSLNTPGLRVVKESRFEESPLAQSRLKSQNKFKSDISAISKQTGVGEILNQLKERIDQVGKSKIELIQIFDKMKAEPKVQLDASKLRVLKTRIDKVYIPMIAKPSVTKEELMNQKIEINKILDEVICPFVK